MWQIYAINQHSQWELWADGFPRKEDAYFFLWCRNLAESGEYFVSDGYPLTLPEQLLLSLERMG